VRVHVARKEDIRDLRVHGLHGLKDAFKQGDGGVATEGGELRFVVGKSFADIFPLLATIGLAAIAFHHHVFI
jgi:hypothetical protein